MLALIPVILQLIQAGLTIAPELISAGQTEVDLVNSGAAPTADQKAQIDAALEQANTALQAAQPAP